MNPDLTVSASLDYLVELCDDGNQAEQPEPGVITLPPTPHAADTSAAPPSEESEG
jgi:hypothetical protein